MSYENNNKKGWFSKFVDLVITAAAFAYVHNTSSYVYKLPEKTFVSSPKIVVPPFHAKNCEITACAPPYVQTSAAASPMYQDYLPDKEVAFKKKAADPATTAQVVQELEAHIQNSQTPDGIDEIINLFEQNKRWT